MSKFKFKQFEVVDDHCAMKIGTDGTMLGCWADFSEDTRILDVGCGSGVISLCAAQKNSTAKILGIDLDEGAVKDALLNFKNSPWSDRIECIHQDLKNLEPTTLFSHVISNPPFFSNSLPSKKINRATARHNDHLSYKDLINFSDKWLTSEGKLTMVLPVAEAEKAINYAKEKKCNVVKLCKVRPVPSKDFHRYLITFTKKKSTTIEEELTIETGIKRHDYTPEYKKLGKNFYLKF